MATYVLVHGGNMSVETCNRLTVGKPVYTEDGFLGQAFDAGLSIAQLANEHQRSEGAIRSRLARLGKLAPRTTPQTKS